MENEALCSLLHNGKGSRIECPGVLASSRRTTKRISDDNETIVTRQWEVMQGFHVCLTKRSAENFKKAFGCDRSHILPVTVSLKHFVAAGHNDGERGKPTAVFTHINLKLATYNRALSAERKRLEKIWKREK